MDNQLLEQLKSVGVDTDGAMERFLNNLEFYEKMLSKFKKDPNYAGISEAWEAGKFETARPKVHALKGVCANLGLNSLYRITANMMEDFCENQPEKAAVKFSNLKAEYLKIMSLLEQI